MSKKYVIEINPEYEDSFKGVMILGAKDSNLFVDTLAVESLEELNSDYINEHYGELQDEAYQRGFEDGKESTEKGCEGCAYETARDGTCVMCSNNYRNLWEKLNDTSDRIEVGDEVISDAGTKYTVTSITGKDSAVGFSGRGLWCFNAIDKLKKTGKHYDIASILEEMRK